MAIRYGIHYPSSKIEDILNFIPCFYESALTLNLV